MAQTAKFTAGPWTAFWSRYDEGVYVVKAGQPSNRVLAKFDGDGDGPDAQSIADAHLIAAAPDLLAALKAMEKTLCDGFDTQAQRTASRLALIATRAAISKAEGSL